MRIKAQRIALPVLLFSLYSPVMFAQSMSQGTEKLSSCPDYKTICPNNMPLSQAESCGWIVLPGVPAPSDPLTCSNCQPTQVNNYRYTCSPYNSNQAPFVTGLYHP